MFVVALLPVTYKTESVNYLAFDDFVRELEIDAWDQGGLPHEFPNGLSQEKYDSSFIAKPSLNSEDLLLAEKQVKKCQP